MFSLSQVAWNLLPPFENTLFPPQIKITDSEKNGTRNKVVIGGGKKLIEESNIIDIKMIRIKAVQWLLVLERLRSVQGRSMCT